MIVIIMDNSAHFAEGELEDENAVLKDMADENMIDVHALFLQSYDKKLLSGIAMVTDYGQIVDVNTIAGNLLNTNFDRLSLKRTVEQEAIIKEKLIPKNLDANSIVTADNIIISTKPEIVYGAELKIEYKYDIGIKAYYGSGEITQLLLEDNKSSNLDFSPYEQMITCDKTNSYYYWEQSASNPNILKIKGEDGILSDQEAIQDLRLVLAAKISQDNYEEIFSNWAKARITIVVGDDGEKGSATKASRAMDVSLLPPTGDEKVNTQSIVEFILGIVVILGIIFFIRKSK